MSKSDVVAQQKSAILAGQDQALQGGLESTYDMAFGEGVASVPPADAEEQTKIDAAVKAQKDADQSVIDGLNQQISDLQAKDAADIQAGQDAVTQIQSSMTDLQSKFDILSAKESTEASVLQGLQGSIAALQNVIAVLQALPTQSAPEPQPEPVPVPDQPAQT